MRNHYAATVAANIVTLKSMIRQPHLQHNYTYNQLQGLKIVKKISKPTSPIAASSNFASFFGLLAIL